MFGIGAGEMMLLLLIAFIVIGPQKLPELARTVGKTVAQFKAYADDMRASLPLDEINSTVNEIKGVATSIMPTSHFPTSGGAQAYTRVQEQLANSTVSSASNTEGSTAAEATTLVFAPAAAVAEMKAEEPKKEAVVETI